MGPQIALEIAFDGIQESKRHKSGYALRLPRIAHLGDDKTVEQISTIDEVRRIYEGRLERDQGPRQRGVNMPLHRSRRHRMIAGVCGGVAEWLGWSPAAVRFLYVLISILSVAFPGIIVYIALWIIMPEGSE